MHLNLELIATFAATTVLLLGFLSLINPLATAVKLVDHPDGDRKQHDGLVPLTGGAALLLTFFTIFILTPIDTQAIGYPLDFWPTVGVLLTVLVAAHVIDDVLDIDAVVRLGIDGTIGVLLCTLALLQLDTLGYLFGPAEMTLGRWAVPMTVFSFVAASNAFNWTDGIDSLCSGLGIVCFATLIALLRETSRTDVEGLVDLCILIITALIPMYMANLGLFGRRLKSFLGDSGARLIGFIAAIVLIYAARKGMIDPVVAYFPIAVPVCDCLILMAVRISQKRSPLSADRLHVHHLMMNVGLSATMTRHLLLLIGLLLGALGVMLQYLDVEEWLISIVVVVSFWLFIALRVVLVKLASRADVAQDTPAVT